MSVIRIRKGRDIRLKGAAEKRIEDTPVPPRVAIQPSDFRGLRPRLVVKVGDLVKVGSTVLTDKTNPSIKMVSPASGKVIEINRGEKRALLEIVIETDGKQEGLQSHAFSNEDIKRISREDVIAHLLEDGVWPCVRQRPFSRIANPQDLPKAIFIQAYNTEPLALDVDVILRNREEEFRKGLELVSKLTQGKVYVCTYSHASSKALTEDPALPGVEFRPFSGPHPTGNVSTFIHYLDPIKKGDIVWYIRAEDVLRIATIFLKGTFLPDRYVAVTGEGASKRIYKKTIIGASLAHLLDGASPEGMRCISGSVLTGTNVGARGFLRFYDSQITIIPEGGRRELLGWLNPGFHKYSFSKTFVSSFENEPAQEVSLDADKRGSDRAIVLNHIYDDYVAWEIMTYFLLRAVLAGEIEEAEQLGILECDEEDFALCTFACPSKTDVGAIIRQGLELIEKEG